MPGVTHRVGAASWAVHRIGYGATGAFEDVVDAVHGPGYRSGWPLPPLPYRPCRSTIVGAPIVVPITASAQAGNWSNPTTWVGGVVPNSGDRVSISHAVTVDVDTTVGDSPTAGTNVVVVTSTGSITINASVLFRVRGGVLVTGAGVVTPNTYILQLAGSIFELDSSQSASPATTSYGVQLGTAHFEYPRWETQGTAGSRCIIRSNAGGANGFFGNANTWIGENLFRWVYTDVIRLGTAAIPAMRFWPNTTPNQGPYWDHCIFDTCGEITSANLDPALHVDLLNTTFRNSLNANNITLSRAGTPVTGRYNVKFLVADQLVRFFTINFATIDDCVFLKGFSMTDDLSTGTVSFQRNLVAYDLALELNVPGPSVIDGYWVKTGAIPNPHFMNLSTDRNCDVDGIIFEAPISTDDQGDGITWSAGAAAARHYNIKRNITLPHPTDLNSCTLLSLLGGANLTVTVEHNTAYVSNFGGVHVGETYAGHIGMLDSLKSNLGWDTTPRHSLIHNVGLAVNNVVLPANCDFNAKFNLAPGVSGNGYNIPQSGGSPGANDIVSDPQFVDRFRNFAAWDLSLGGPGTVVHALSEIAKMNDPSGYNPAYTTMLFVAYIREGFRPTNPAYAAAAHDGTTPGAVQFISATVVGTASDADRNWATPYQDVQLVFSQTMEDAALVTGGTATGHTIKINGVAQATTYRSGSGTNSWVLRVPVLVKNGDVITYSYDPAVGATTHDPFDALGELPVITDEPFTNNLTKRIREVINKADNTPAAGETVKLAVANYGAGNPANANFMAIELKTTCALSGAGVLDAQYTGADPVGTTKYISVIRTNAAPVESAVWTTVVT